MPEILCIRCGKGGLDLVSTKLTSADSGYCPRCRVYMHGECAKPNRRSELRPFACPECGSALREDALYDYTAGAGLLLFLVFMPLALLFLSAGQGWKGFILLGIALVSGLLGSVAVIAWGSRQAAHFAACASRHGPAASRDQNRHEGLLGTGGA
jgi:DNA-directed RNA polymerase subunit RPC12/RpoP